MVANIISYFYVFIFYNGLSILALLQWNQGNMILHFDYASSAKVMDNILVAPFPYSIIPN